MRPDDSFVGQPVRSLQTMLRVLSRQDPSLPGVVPDGIYGPQTMSAVSAFQRKRGIPVTGVADQTTWDAIAAAFRPARTQLLAAQPIQIVMNPNQVFRSGQSSPYLYLAQSMLLTLSRRYRGFPAPSLSGTLDTQTAAALTRFQQVSALDSTGDLDKITWKHLSLQYTLAAAWSGMAPSPG